MHRLNNPRRLPLGPQRPCLTALALCGVAAFLFSGCAAFVSDQDEIALGAKYRQELERQVTLDANAADRNYINTLGQNLVRAAPPRPAIPFSFDIVREKELNAFAIPGGHVYVNTGLIEAASNESELAAVMAHEIGHVVALHHKETMGRELGVGMINEIVFGQNAQNARALAELVEQGAMLHFSRSQEYQADEIGLYTMSRAGYDPEGMVTFFGKLMNQGGSSSNRLFELFSSHPLTRERIDRAQSLLPRYRLPGATRRDSAAFQALRARLK